MNKFHESVFDINLNDISRNIDYLKSKLKKSTKIIAVIKAYGYGHGDIEIAKKLESLDVYAFWVADFEEGMRLRQSGVKKTIIIANPSPRSTEQIINYRLDVVIYNFRLLDAFGKLNEKIKIHIKFNTGMNRFGFEENDIAELKKRINQYPNLKIESVCSHLSSSRNPKKDQITLNQLKNFEKIILRIKNNFSVKPLVHILNTNGVLRFTEHQYNAVRIGIGIFGIHEDKKLIQIGALSSSISQIRHLKRGDKIGYDAMFICKKNMRVGIIPFGYADGLNRQLGNQKGSLAVNGKLCSIIGNISMDSCVIDLTESDAKEGDRVEIFGPNNNIDTICKQTHSIPYEFLSKINRRIKRIYNSSTS
tara:strand:+ start:948 stop:2036 length:1089 start_codon:yes stop_codon:yes gene_type:complete